MSNTLGFLSADTLGLTIHQTKEGELVGGETRVLSLGPWNIDVPVTAQSDIINSREISYWVQVGRMRMYVIVRMNDVWVVVLSANKLKEREKTGFVGTVIRERIVEIKPAAKGVFKWTESDKQWRRYDVKLLD